MMAAIAEDAIDLLLPARQLTRARTWTGDTEWYTPPDILEAACAVLGAIDLDPASSDAQQALAPVRGASYFTVENSGLDQPWCGRVWLNPPYARGWIDRFVAKMVQSYRSGEMQAGIMLTNSATETTWWQSAAGACEALCFRKGRVRFLKIENGILTTGGSSPSHPHTLFYFGPDAAHFAYVFRPFGLVFSRPL
jgi:ParB family transcriptional regulator, chromosome partitioning protein